MARIERAWWDDRMTVGLRIGGVDLLLPLDEQKWLGRGFDAVTVLGEPREAGLPLLVAPSGVVDGPLQEWDETTTDRDVVAFFLAARDEFERLGPGFDLEGLLDA